MSIAVTAVILLLIAGAAACLITLVTRGLGADRKHKRRGEGYGSAYRRPGGSIGRVLAKHDLIEAMRRVQERDDEQGRAEGKLP
jgi:hypothetical protein